MAALAAGLLLELELYFTGYDGSMAIPHLPLGEGTLRAIRMYPPSPQPSLHEFFTIQKSLPFSLP